MNDNHKQVSSLWAKKEEKASRFYWLPLEVHLEDTMNVSRWLWNNWLSDSQREFCTKSINPSDDETASNLAAFLGAVHDIGKATPAFQIQKGYRNSTDLDAVLLEKLELAGFLGISSLTLANPSKTHHSIAGEYILTKYHIKHDIGSIVGGHHGKPVDDRLSIEDQSAYPANYYQSEDDSLDVHAKWKRAQCAIFQSALESSGFDSVEQLPEISLPAQVIYSGLLIMADWISSNSDYFSLIDINTEYISDANARFRKGISLWSKNLPLQIQSYPEMDDLYIHRFGFKPRGFQKTAYQTVSQIIAPGIIIIEAAMGLGKTEAALALTEIVSAKTGSSGVFFGLPTQATSNGMFGRVCAWLKNLTDENGIEQSIRLCHGKAALNKEMERLRNVRAPQDINIDEKNNGNVFVNEWFSGRKKTVLDDFVVGTVDSFLLTALKQKHLALRHLGFSKKIVIIDEVHAYDTYMQQYLEEALRWMGAYGTPVILASATLPYDRRKSLIAAYLKGMGIKNRDIQFPEAMSGSSYPLISYSEGSEVKVQTDFPNMEDKVVRVNRMNEEDLIGKVEELIENGGVVGIIVNTVRRAQKLCQICRDRFGENVVDLLHSAFIVTDRVSKESDLLNMIGKQGDRPERKIIIGTQVIEQSLDIDLDVLITDLCPVDLMLQRIGRLHRHDINRPEKHKYPVAYVLGMSDVWDFEKGSERVYWKYFLIRTQYYLPNEIRIPSDIPILVNKVYGDDPPEFAGKQQELYQESCNQMEIMKKNKADKAKTYRIKNPGKTIKPGNYNMMGWLKNPDYSNSEETAAAQVRDIKETIEVIAVKRIGSGYGIFGSNEDISDQIGDSNIAKELANQTIRVPDYVTSRKGISKTIEYLEEYNWEYLYDWQNQPWLKGALGIIFDELGRFELNGIILRYDKEYGLREEEGYGK